MHGWIGEWAHPRTRDFQGENPSQGVHAFKEGQSPPCVAWAQGVAGVHGALGAHCGKLW